MVRDSYVQRQLQTMREQMEVRRLKPLTVSTYVRCLRQFVMRVGQPLGRATTRNIEQYLLALARDGIHPRTRNVILVALRFAFRASPHRRNPTAGVPLAKAQRRVPEILSGSR